MSVLPMKRNSMKKETPDAPLAPVQDVAAVVKIETASVTIPYIVTQTSEDDYSTQCRRVDMAKISKDHARKLRAIRRGYIVNGTKLSNGGEIKSLADALRAFLDSVEI